MALTVLKNTPTHAVVVVSNNAASTETLTLASLALAGTQTAVGPRVNIKAVTIAAPQGSVCTVTRNSEVLWKTDNNIHVTMDYWADTRQNSADIVIVTGSTGGTIVLELSKASGYGDTQHINPS